MSSFLIWEIGTDCARVGNAVDRVLLYGSAGGAFGSMQTAFSDGTTTKTQACWTAGAGIEWALTDDWTAKVEYL